MLTVPGRTDGSEYTARLTRLGEARWKRVLDVQAPYRRNLRRLLGGRRVLDVGCGIGRHLAHLDAGSVGVDHNAASVAVCRRRGLAAHTPDELPRTPGVGPAGFDGLLAAHLLEHLDPAAAREVLRDYLPLLAPWARVVLVCPQQRGFRSDPTHVAYLDDAALREVLEGLGGTVTEQRSFPFPRVAGPWFTHNEFVTVGVVGGPVAA